MPIAGLNELMPRGLWKFLGALFVLSAACLGTKLYCGHVLHLGPPYNTVVSGDLGDLKAYANIMPLLGQYGFLQMDDHPIYMYPAPVALEYATFYALPHKTAVMYALIVGTFVAGGVLLGRGMVRRGMTAPAAAMFVAASFLMAYPVWYETRAGNMEIVTFLLVAGAAWAFMKDRSMLAAACIGVAAATKMYPAVLLGVLLARRQYKAVAVAALTGGALTLFALWFITPSISYSWHGVEHGIRVYKYGVFEFVNTTVIGWDHSLFTVPKRVLLSVAKRPAWMHRMLNAYLVTVAIGCVALFFLRIRKLPLVNQMILLTSAGIFLPPSSYDYTLMLLYVPWAMLVLYVVETWEERVPGRDAMLVGFAGLLAILDECIRHWMGFGGQVRAIIFVGVFVLALLYPLGLRFEAEERLRMV